MSLEEASMLGRTEVARRKKEMFKKIALCMENGMSAEEAFEKFRNEYADYTGNILTRIAVSREFISYLGKDKQNMIIAERRKQAEKLLEKGMNEKDVAERLGVSRTYLRRILGRVSKPRKKQEVNQKSEDLNIVTINIFKDIIKEGDVLDCTVSKSFYTEAGRFSYKKVNETVKVLRKYPFVVETDKGSFRWIDLYLYWKERMNDEKNTIGANANVSVLNSR